MIEETTVTLATVVSLNRRLPRAVWILQAGLVFNALGNGAVNPFTVIYLHDVRDIPLGSAGLVAATSSLAALGGALTAGSIADRLGPRATLLGGLALAAGAFACYPLIRATCMRSSWRRSPAPVVARG